MSCWRFFSRAKPAAKPLRIETYAPTAGSSGGDAAGAGRCCRGRGPRCLLACHNDARGLALSIVGRAFGRVSRSLSSTTCQLAVARSPRGSRPPRGLAPWWCHGHDDDGLWRFFHFWQDAPHCVHSVRDWIAGTNDFATGGGRFFFIFFYFY